MLIAKSSDAHSHPAELRNQMEKPCKPFGIVLSPASFSPNRKPTPCTDPSSRSVGVPSIITQVPNTEIRICACRKDAATDAPLASSGRMSNARVSPRCQGMICMCAPTRSPKYQYRNGTGAAEHIADFGPFTGMVDIPSFRSDHIALNIGGKSPRKLHWIFSYFNGIMGKFNPPLLSHYIVLYGYATISMCQYGG